MEYINENLVAHLETQFSATSRALETEEYRQGIQRALRGIDRDLGERELRGGSTVALALIDTRQGVLIAADLGDSHIVYADHGLDYAVGSEDGSAISESAEGWRVEVVSVEHTPDNPEERKRVEDAGGQINYVTGIPRIGGVSMARALGDIQFKKPRVNRLAGHDLSDLVGIETGVAPGKTVTQDLVSNRGHFTIKEFSGQTLILLASDGVGNAKDAEDITKYALEKWHQGKTAQEITEEITAQKGSEVAADNCTVLIIVVGMDAKERRSPSTPRFSLEVNETKKRRRSERSSMARLIDWIR